MLLGYGYANSSGIATLNLTWLPCGNTATVTVTNYNCTPYIATSQLWEAAFLPPA